VTQTSNSSELIILSTLYLFALDAKNYYWIWK
jgi:hypothetical protein